MKKGVLAAFLAVLLLLPGCTPGEREAEGAAHILCTTYPVYLFTTAVVGETEGVAVDLLVNQPTSCLHDYTLTVNDMKAIEAAGVIVMNGVGLEDFMAGALDTSDAAVIDCSAGVDLLPLLEEHGHEGHDHGEEYDPHIWMDPHRAGQMVENIAAGLSELDPDHAGAYGANAAAAVEALEQFIQRTGELREEAAVDYYMGHPEMSFFPPMGEARFYWRPGLITFHDGFQYFAAAQGFELLKAIEEEEGSTASAAEIKEIAGLVEDRAIPAIFTEKNGSAATARVIARETGCAVYELDMVMSGEGAGIQPYLDAMEADLRTVLEAFQ